MFLNRKGQLKLLEKLPSLNSRYLKSMDENNNPVLGPVLMTGDKLVKSQAGYDSSGKIIVSMTFTAEGPKNLKK